MSSSAAGVTYVGFWPRVWASVIDSIMLLVVIVPAILVIYGEEYLRNTAIFKGPADFVLQVIFPAIVVVAFWIYRKATPGKMVIHAKIVDARTGNAPSKQQLIVRYLGYYVSIFTLFIGFVWVAFDARKQGLHDKLAGTVVVRD